MDTHWYSSTKRGVTGLAGKSVRIASALGLLAMTFGPLPNAPLSTPAPGAEAAIVDWDDVRGPLTDDGDSVETNGFRKLTAFADDLHAITVASNGDVFTAGGGAAATVIYRSTDGGFKWREADRTDAAISALPAGAIVHKIVVSPNYPSDSFVLAVFSDNDTAGGEATDGIAWSTDGGLTFPNVITGTTWGNAEMDVIDWRTAALSTDFDLRDDEGAIALGGYIGGASTASAFRISAATFAAGGTAAGVAAAAWTPLGYDGNGDGTLEEDTGDRTLFLTYSADPDGGTLGRLWINDDATPIATGTYGQTLTTSTGFQNTGGGLIHTPLATAGEVAFDSTTDFRSGDRWWAATSVGGVGGAGSGGVYRFSSGAWENRSTVDTDCNIGYSSLTVSGTGSDTRVVAAQDLGNRVCRSSNNGSSWSDVQADGGDDNVDGSEIDPPLATYTSTRLGSRMSDPNVVYWTTSGDLGGVLKSTNNGASFRDTGLTNDDYSLTGASMDFISDTEVIVRVGAGGSRALFKTTTFGTGAAWQRVFRAPDIDAVELPDDIATSRVVWAVRTGTGEERVIRSTDGGLTWFPTAADPVDDEVISEMSALTASTAYIGLEDEGDVYRTTDGGASWTKLDKDFGRGIDEFDFANETVFFVTGLDNDDVMKVWQTRDGGATFTQIGDAPWGTGCTVGDATFRAARYNATTNEGWGIFMAEGGCTTDEIYRIKIGTDTSWTDLDLDQEWENIGSFATTQGDQYALWMWTDNEGGCSAILTALGCLRYTVWPFTGDKDDMNIGTTGSDEADNLILHLPTPPACCQTMESRTSAEGTQFRTTPAQRWLFFTITKQFRDGPKINSPVNNASVPANTGDNGVPLTLRWEDVPNAEDYEVIMGQNPNLSDGAILGTTASNRFTVTAAIEPLTQGNQFYWAVRVTACNVDTGEEGDDPNECESPWSSVSSFTVSTTSTQVTTPQPNLPLNGSQLPGLTTELSWNNPPGVTQVQVQIIPLNGDGPAINLILGAAVSRYVVPAPVFGTGPYVMLPGASYTWRVRTTGSASPTITESDPSWGPWSEPRTFTSRRPDAGTIQLVGPINGATVSDTTPSLEWKNAATDEFYYEVQLSADPNFNMNPATATAAVYWNLIHGGQSTPPNSWTVPDSAALKPGTYYWRVRQRLQATPAGSAEVGVAWSPAQRFVVQ